MQFLNSPEVLKAVDSSSRGATRPRMTLGMLKTLEVPMPSMEEQRAIAAGLEERLAAVAEITKSVEAEAEAINRLPPALLRRAFNSDAA